MISRTDLSTRLTAACLLMVAAAYLLFAIRNYGYELDDALIYMRYVQNLVDGHGLVYNSGERFDGLTSPLFTYAIVPIALLTRNVHFATWLLSAVFTFAAFCVFFAIFRDQLKSTAAPPLTSALLGLAISVALPYFFTTYGMETGLFILLCGLTLRSYLVRDGDRFCLNATLLVLTRPEGLALVAACGLCQLAAKRGLPKVQGRTILICLVLLAVVIAANLYFFHVPWAQTGAAKIWQGKSGFWGERLTFWKISYLVDPGFAGSITSAIMLLAAAAIGLLVLGRREINVVLLLFLSFYAAFYTAFNIPNYHWYYSVFFMLLPFYAATGAGYVALTLVRGDATVRARVLAIAILFAGVYPVSNFLSGDATAKKAGAAPYARAGKWIAQNTPEDSSFAASEIGALGWYSGRKVVDILGLVSPDNARLIGERNFDGWVDGYQPQYLLTHEPPTPVEMALYTFVNRFSVTQQCGFPEPGYAFYRIDYHGGPSSFCDTSLRMAPVTIAKPRLAPGFDQGHVDAVTVSGNFVRMSGWASDGAGGPFAELTAPADRYSRPDVAAALRNNAFDQSGFNMVLRFASNEQARSWAANPCLLSAGKAGARVIKGIDGSPCGGGLPFADSFE